MGEHIMKSGNNTRFSKDINTQKSFTLSEVDINHTIEQIFKRYRSSQDTLNSGMYRHVRKEIESLQKWVYTLHSLNVDLREIEAEKIYDRILSLYEESFTEQAEHAQIWFSDLYCFVNEQYQPQPSTLISK